MGYERYSRNTNPQGDYYDRSEPQDYGQDYGSGGAFSYSSARDYEAAGEIGPGDRGGYRSRRDFGGRSNFGGPRSDMRQPEYRARDVGRPRNYGRPPRGYDYDERGFMERAGDEVRSWFGDDEAERRREMDMRHDERQGRRWDSPYGEDSDYHHWRREQISALDRDYDEYRRENRQKFHNEFGSWRQERQGQRGALNRVSEHMEVIGSDGEHVGTVDKVRGDRIILTKSDPDAGGHHHSIPSRWIETVDDKVTIRKTASDAKAHWKDEERSQALFSDGTDRDVYDVGAHKLGRSFSGTY